MKISGLLVLSIVLFVYGDDPHASIRANCRNELNLTDQELIDAIPDPINMDCYLYCFLMDINVMDIKGNFNPAAAVQSIQDELKDAAKPNIYACYEQTKENMDEEPCTRAYDVIKCFQTRSPDLYEKLGIFRPPTI
ncbi:hypothetical protein HCN44_005311 [Aphidius gifuensis]|uniref:Odorant-binding protein n=1 Tax=Aphidius gifuensis TaxID=684658 RepID=A0A3Q9ELR0_APHGI|nr:uncharacterized protein LOC122856268 [Aphidius gifuensis]AZQ24992.1 odorant-binding protein [Aphidius gifuensis]KAF7997034.1 hypothetical protein HCN44_005311 [Aphidius gifuensis]